MAPTQAGMPDGKVAQAAEVYVYGYTLVYSMGAFADYVAGGGAWPMKAPYNQFGHNRELSGPETRFVSPNNDTCYSIAVCDVRKEPLVLHVPETSGRYFVMQFIDAWSNNFAYVGRRVTGSAEGEFLLADRSYTGEVPDAMRVVHAPSGAFLIGGRYQVDGADDLPAVHTLQDQTTLTPLSQYKGGSTSLQPDGVPSPDPRVPKELAWWEYFRVALAAFPPPEADASFLELCKQFGLLEADSPYIDMDQSAANVLVEGQKAGQAEIEKLEKEFSKPTDTGWQSALHLFDYNLDYFEIGAIDAPEWKIADRKKAYLTRAIAARVGMWGNNGYEADYAAIWVDGDGNPLDGSHRYELCLDPPPPVDAFWSLTMYEPPEFYLIANPIDRYSIGDRTAGLKAADDGSVTIYVQHDSPGPDNEANWLPAPAGAFRPVMRMYNPRKEILDGSYQLPAIKKVG